MEIENRYQLTDYLTLQRFLRKEKLLPGQAQIGYVVGETSDNEPASLERAFNLLKQGVIEKIAIPDPLPPYNYGYPGPNYCRQILLDVGTRENQILTISPETHSPGMNTQTELAMVAKFIKKTEYKSGLIIIAPWFHILRSYITALSELKNVGLDTKVFISSVPLTPYETVKHSQGVQEGSRRNIFNKEIAKCKSYKNLVPVEEALEIYKIHRNKDSD